MSEVMVASVAMIASDWYQLSMIVFIPGMVTESALCSGYCACRGLIAYAAAVLHAMMTRWHH